MSTVTARRNYEAPSISAEQIDARYADSGRCIKDRFVACKVGGMLILKLVGFIEDEGAEITSVSEEHVTLRLGQPWHRRLFGVGKERRRPVEVNLRFAEPGEDLSTWQAASARRSVIEVQIRPQAATFRTRDFHRRADAILRTLRLHFVAD